MEFIHMKLIRVRKMGPEKVLVIPRDIADKTTADYMAVKLDESGRLIYTPVSEVL